MNSDKRPRACGSENTPRAHPTGLPFDMCLRHFDKTAERDERQEFRKSVIYISVFTRKYNQLCT